MLWIRGLPMAHANPVLRTRRSDSSKLGHCAAILAARWGRLGGWLPSGAEDVANLITVLPSRRIEGSGPVGHGDSGDRGGQVRLVSWLPWHDPATHIVINHARAIGLWGNHEVCSKRLAAWPNTQADDARSFASQWTTPGRESFNVTSHQTRVCWQRQAGKLPRAVMQVNHSSSRAAAVAGRD